MSLKNTILEGMKKSLKEKDKLKTSILRMLLAAIKNKEIEVQHELNDDEVINVLNTFVKQHKESIEGFKKASRNDLVLKEETELKIIRSFLPPPLSQKEIEEVVGNVILETGAKGIKDLGKVMKELMARVKGRADGKILREMVQKRLSS